MGIGGHMLGPRKLRRLKALTGLDVARAYRRGRYAEGVVWSGDQHTHYAIDWESGEVEPLDTPLHWWSCGFLGSVVPERTDGS